MVLLTPKIKRLTPNCNRFGTRSQRTTIVNLIIINALVYLAQVAFGGGSDVNKISDLFALHHYKSDVFRPYQVVTHMFMHGSFFTFF